MPVEPALVDTNVLVYALDADAPHHAVKRVVTFRRDDEDEVVSSAKCFGYVQSYDEKPRQRLWELMKSQGM